MAISKNVTHIWKCQKSENVKIKIKVKTQKTRKIRSLIMTSNLLNACLVKCILHAWNLHACSIAFMKCMDCNLQIRFVITTGKGCPQRCLISWPVDWRTRHSKFRVAATRNRWVTSLNKCASFLVHNSPLRQHWCVVILLHCSVKSKQKFRRWTFWRSRSGPASSSPGRRAAQSTAHQNPPAVGRIRPRCLKPDMFVETTLKVRR